MNKNAAAEKILTKLEKLASKVPMFSHTDVDGDDLILCTDDGTFVLTIKQTDQAPRLEAYLESCVYTWVDESMLLEAGPFTRYDVMRAVQNGLLRLADLGEEFDGDGCHSVCTVSDPVYHVVKPRR